LSPEASFEEATFSSTTAMITGPVTDEIQLSEDIIVRPRSKSRATPPPPPPPAVEEQQETAEADLSETVDTGSELISSAPSNEIAEPAEEIVAEEIVDEQPEVHIEEPAEPVRTGDDISDLVSETSKPR
jgi:hypothetical protein